MTWAKLDDSYPHHPKMLAAGLEALGFDAAGLCYSARFGTDGFIADSMLPAVYPGARNPADLAAKLVEVGRWHRDNRRGGWVIHDFLDYNPPASEVAELRRKRSAAGRKGGKQSGKQRRQQASSNTEATDEASASANASGGASRVLEAKPNPVPVPHSVSPDGDTGTAPPAAQHLLAEHIDAHPRRPPARVIGHLAREIRALIDEGWETDDIRAGLATIRERGLNPSTLASCVNDAANTPAARAATNGSQWLTAAEQRAQRRRQAITEAIQEQAAGGIG